MGKTDGVCSFEGCNRKVLCRNLCNMHYIRWQRNKPMGGRTIYTPNEFIFIRGECHIALYDKTCKKVADAVIDADDALRCMGKKWTLGKRGYVYHGIEPLHRFIMNLTTKDKAAVDHINHNKLDNRKINLRLCSMQENLWNQKLRADNTSGHKGVFWDKHRGSWKAYLRDRTGREVYIGNFNNKLDAARVRAEKSKKERGEFHFDGHITGD